MIIFINPLVYEKQGVIFKQSKPKIDTMLNLRELRKPHSHLRCPNYCIFWHFALKMTADSLLQNKFAVL